MAEEEGEWRDILGSGAVLKRVVRQGDGPCPEFKQQVQVHQLLRTSEGQEVSNSREDGAPLWVTIGDKTLERVVPGVMLAVKTMRTGEVADVKLSHRFAFADEGLPPLVGANQDIEARLELMHIDEMEKEAVDMSPSELVEAVRIRKERGNEFFRANKLMKALRCYQEGLKMSESHLPPAPGPGEEEPAQVPKDEYNDHPDLLRLRLETTGNIAACFEKQGKLKEAKDACIAVLSGDPSNLKALLRASRVAALQGEYVEATACARRAREAHPDSKEAAREIKQLKARIDEYKARKREQFGGVLGPASTPSDSPPSGSSAPASKAPTPEALSPVAAGASATTAAEPAKKAAMQRPKPPLTNLLVLLAPILLALAALLVLPRASAAPAARWRQLSKDRAMKELRTANFENLVCEGRHQRPSCCVCLEAIKQAVLRQATFAEYHPDRATSIKSYRVGDKPRVMPLEESEIVLVSILDKVCDAVPVDIPASATESQVAFAKREFALACSRLVDEFYDEILAAWRRRDFGERSLEHLVCRDIAGVCEPREPWPDRLRALGPDYADFPCALCRKTSALLVEQHTGPNGPLTEPQLRTPSKLCSLLSLGVPARETRLDLVGRAIGHACVDLCYEHRSQVLSALSARPAAECEAELGCGEALEAELCAAVCAAP